MTVMAIFVIPKRGKFTQLHFLRRMLLWYPDGWCGTCLLVNNVCLFIDYCSLICFCEHCLILLNPHPLQLYCHSALVTYVYPIKELSIYLDVYENYKSQNHRFGIFLHLSSFSFSLSSLRELDKTAELAVLGHSVAAYMSTLDGHHLKHLTNKIVADVTTWLCDIFRFCTLFTNCVVF